MSKTWIYGLAGLAGGYLLATYIKSHAAVKGSIGAYKLKCSCASGVDRLCDDGTCSCCPGAKGFPVGVSYDTLSAATVPANLRKTVGLV